MSSYEEYSRQHVRLLRKRIIEILEEKGFSSLHDLHLNQNWDYNLPQDSSWKPISKKALYSLIQQNSNPTLETLLKFCYLLSIDITTLFKEENINE